MLGPGQPHTTFEKLMCSLARFDVWYVVPPRHKALEVSSDEALALRSSQVNGKVALCGGDTRLTFTSKLVRAACSLQGLTALSSNVGTEKRK